MKQKKLGDILYVFDVNPYEITQDTDATTIKVQEESYKGFVEMNPSLAEKIVKYNYHTMCVNVPEWAPYVEQEDPQEQLTFGIYGSAAEASIAQVQRQNANNDILENWVAGQNLNFPFQASFNEGEHFAVEFVNGVNPDLLNITGDALSAGWQDPVTNNFWKATAALSTSTSVGIDASEPQEQLTFGIYGSAAEASIAQVQRQDANNDILETWVAGQNLNFPFQVSFNEGEHFAVEFVNGVNPDLLNITGDALSIGWQDAETNNFWKATAALSTSTSVGIDKASPSTYKLYLQGPDINDTNLRVDINRNQVALEALVAGIDIAQDTLIEVWLLTENINDYDVSSISTWMNESTDGGHLHYWRNMPAEDKTIDIAFIGGVNFNASWDDTPENVSQINIGNTSVTGSDLTDRDWAETVHLHPGTSQVTFFVSTGLPTDMTTFKVGFKVDEQTGLEEHYAYKQTDHDTGRVWYSDTSDASGSGITNPGTWTYNNTPSTGLPWIAFTLPSTDANGNAFVDNTEIKINSRVSGS